MACSDDLVFPLDLGFVVRTNDVEAEARLLRLELLATQLDRLRRWEVVYKWRLATPGIAPC